MTTEKKVVYIGVEYAGKPFMATVTRHCKKVSCLLGRFDISNSYKLTESSYKRIGAIASKRAFGQVIISKVVYSFGLEKNDK